jgi:hypothetical protein
MYTGSGKLEDTRRFHSIEGFENARFNYTAFDGNAVSSGWDNPWLVDEPVNLGSDGIMN